VQNCVAVNGVTVMFIENTGLFAAMGRSWRLVEGRWWRTFFIVVLVMGTSVGAVVGVDELTGTAINISTENYRWIEMFIVVAGLYVVLTLIASLSLARARAQGSSRKCRGAEWK